MILSHNFYTVYVYYEDGKTLKHTSSVTRNLGISWDTD